MNKILAKLNDQGYAVSRIEADITELLDIYREKIFRDFEDKNLKISRLGGFIAGHLNYAENDVSAAIFKKIITKEILEVIKSHLNTRFLKVRTNSNLNLTGSHHQHWHYDGDYKNNFIILNVPIVEIDNKNGPTEILKNSHRHITNIREFLKKYKNLKSKKLELRRTEFVFRDSRLWHRGTSNTSKTHRPMLAFIFERSTNQDEYFITEGENSYIYDNMYTGGVLGRLREYIFVYLPALGYIQRFLFKNY